MKTRLRRKKTPLPASRQRDFSRKGTLRAREKSRMTVSMHRVLASLKLPGNASALVIRARVVVDAMTDNPWFPAPVPSLAKVQAAIDALDKAETDVLSRTKGLPAIRNDAKKKLVDYLQRLKGYVQAVANDNPDFAVSIIESAGMEVTERPSPAKAVLAVYPGPVSGSVRLVARAVAKECNYAWQWSDDGGKTWVDLKKTQQANTTTRNLRPGTTYLFRFRAVTRRLTTNWCDPVSYVVQ
jgi:hypothetical protein